MNLHIYKNSLLLNPLIQLLIHEISNQTFYLLAMLNVSRTINLT
jgi:hypothetical protein